MKRIISYWVPGSQKFLKMNSNYYFAFKQIRYSKHKLTLWLQGLKHSDKVHSTFRCQLSIFYLARADVKNIWTIRELFMNLLAIERFNATQNVLFIVNQDLEEWSTVTLRHSHQNVPMHEAPELHARVNTYPVPKDQIVPEILQNLITLVFILAVTERLSQIMIDKVRGSQLDINVTQAITGEFIESPVGIFGRAPVQFDEHFIPECLQGFVDFCIELWEVWVVLWCFFCVPVCWVIVWEFRLVVL